MVNAIETTWDADDNGELINGINLLCPNDGAAHDENDDEDKRCPCCSNDDGYLEPLLNALYPVEIIEHYTDENNTLKKARIEVAANTNMILVQNEETDAWYFASTTAGQSILVDLLKAHLILRKHILGPDDQYSVPLDVAEAITVRDVADEVRQPEMRKLAIRSLLHTLKINGQILENRHDLASKDATELGITV